MIAQIAALSFVNSPLEFAIPSHKIPEANNLLNQYILYKQAANLGLSISANDMDVETIQNLSDFNNEFQKLSDAKANKGSKKR